MVVLLLTWQFPLFLLLLLITFAQEIAKAHAALQEAAEHKSFKKGAALAELLQTHADVAACYASLPAARKTAALQALHRLYMEWTSAGKPFDAAAALKAMQAPDGR